MSSHAFAETNARTISEAAAGARGGTLRIRAYSPPWEGRPPHGYIELCFDLPGEDAAAIGITFGLEEDEAPGAFIRQEFDPDKWSEWKSDPSTGALYAASFDEAWRIVCLVAQKLGITTVTLEYGM